MRAIPTRTKKATPKMTTTLNRTGALVVGIVGLSALAACQVDVTNGVETSSSFTTDDFSSIEIDSAIDAEIIVGEETNVNVIVDNGIADQLEVQVDDGRLYIGLDGVSIDDDGVQTTAQISTPTLDMVNLSGASSADITNVVGDTFDLEVSGAGSVTASGAVDELKLVANGASDVDLADVQIGTADIDVSGASSVELTDAKSVTGSTSGASTVDVDDDASVSVDVSGVGSVD